MAKLAEITPGTRVRGIVGDSPVTIKAVEWHGDSILNVIYKTDQGVLGDRPLLDTDEDKYIIEKSSAWAFDADPDDLRLVSEAYRIGLAHLFDPYLAIRTSSIEPLPHQISAVYKEMLPRLPLRYVLADDPGAGKTIMTGLLIKEMIARGDLRRCLIVAPGNLVEQWQDELWQKFGLRFRLLTNDVLESSATGNPFDEVDFCIGRLDKLARNDEIQKKLRATSWDLVVCDEAHKMSATNFGGEFKPTKRYKLGQLLGDTTENLLLLTATPHNGKPADFRYFMALVDKDRFAGGNRVKNPAARSTAGQAQGLPPAASLDCDVSDVMRRLVKEELLKFDGRPLFPERCAYTVEYDLSPAEQELYDSVTHYVTEEFNRAERLGGKHKNSVGFALTILQRRLASSPEAIFQSLRRRRIRLESKLAEAKSVASGKVGDILGRGTFEGKTLRDLLLDAIRYGDDPEVRARLNQVVDASLDTSSIKRLFKEYALTDDVMDARGVSAIREDMERMEARKLEPHFIQAFFMAAMKRLGGRVASREHGRFEVLEVPFSVRSMSMGGECGHVLASYERICFDKESKEGPGLVPAELVCPGEPLLDATVKVLIGQMGSALKRGCVLVDDRDFGDRPRLLLYIENSVQDGTTLADGTKRTVSKEFRFVEVDAAGEARDAGYAPYLDYRGPRPSEASAAHAIASEQEWLTGDIDALAMDFAIREILPVSLKEVRNRRIPQVEKIERAVDARLTDEANYWDGRAWELEEKEKQGKKTRLSSLNARRRADDLRDRRQMRLAELQREKTVTPATPRVLGGALVIPVGMLPHDSQATTESSAAGRREVELAGMRAVMAIERELGFTPRDRSADNCGYDIESVVPDELRAKGPALRMIEVKGRTAGATTVTVSHNEVMCALNRPDAFVLALVEVDGNTTRTSYIAHPFTSPPDYAAASTNYDIARLKEAGDVILEREQTWQ